MAESWQVSGWNGMTIGKQGMHLHTTENGGMLHPMDLSPDELRIVYGGPIPQDAILLLHYREDPSYAIRQLALTHPVGDTNGNVQFVDFTGLPVDPSTIDFIGIGLPAGTDTVIQGFELVRYSFAEKIANAWESFRSFNTFDGMSINFLWGPLLRFSEDGVATVFTYIPPLGLSVNVVFSCLLGIAVLPLALVTVRRGLFVFSREQAVAFFFVCALCVWIFYDVRMGAEYLASVERDAVTFLVPPAGQRTFRSYDTTYDVLLRAAPFVREHFATFALLRSPNYPIDSRAQYFFYPSVLQRDIRSPSDVRSWFVFKMPEVTVDADGRLLKSGTVIAEHGHIVQRFDDSSFLYAVDQ